MFEKTKVVRSFYCNVFNKKICKINDNKIDSLPKP